MIPPRHQINASVRRIVPIYFLIKTFFYGAEQFVLPFLSRSEISLSCPSIHPSGGAVLVSPKAPAIAHRE